MSEYPGDDHYALESEKRLREQGYSGPGWLSKRGAEVVSAIERAANPKPVAACLPDPPKAQKDEPALRDDGGKNMMQLVPVYPLWLVGQVYTFGATKAGKDGNGYGADNWRGGMSWSRAVGCAMRHLLKFANGQDLDDGPGGSGLPHLAHVAFCVFQLLEYSKTHPEFDDRPRTQAQVPA